MGHETGFADTSFYQALFNNRDKYHETATALIESLQAEIITTDYILTELAALMSRGEARSLFVRFVEQLQSDPATLLVRTSPDIFDKGFGLFAIRPDKEWSLVDCISFTLMQDYGIKEALTFGHHFEQAGFHNLWV